MSAAPSIYVPTGRGPWMQTWSGTQFFLLDPRPEDIDIRDIAHALANQCRYNGHTDRFYCPTPEQRILTADLRWVPAGDLTVGAELLAFDEHPTELGSAGRGRRRFRHATVLVAQPITRRVIRLEMADGTTVRASEEHPWLVATKQSRNQKWCTAKEIATAIRTGRRRYMHRFIEPWALTATREAGWLAGIYDGEGHLSVRNRKGTQLGVSQRPGLVLDEAARVLGVLGFSSLRRTQTGPPHSDVITLQMRGGWRDMARLLGSVRPIRLLDKFTTFLRGGAFDKQMDGIGEPSEIVRAHDEGEHVCAGLETSTHTYICEGFGAHNSVAEHSVMVSFDVPYADRFEGLMHDAAEAYTGDIIRPLKLAFRMRGTPSVLDEIEERIERVIAAKFGLRYPWPPSVKVADLAVLAAERRDTMKPQPATWDALERVTPSGLHVQNEDPGEAELSFLARFDIITRDREASRG